MAASLRWIVLAPVIFSIQIVAATDDEFHEELFVKPLSFGHVYNHFQFTTVLNADLTDGDAFRHYHLFPKSLGEVLHKYSVQELHLSLTQGRWRHESWGYPIADAPPGAELWVWFQEGTTQIDQTWTDLINVLSGMFCASLNFMDTKSTVSPKYSFRPAGVTSTRFNRFSKFLLRYAALPRENVCTENLTPWKKLLPCGGRAGLSSLFNAIKLYDAAYHSLGLHVRPVCRNEACTERSVELSQSLSVVFDVAAKLGDKPDWNMRKLFGQRVLYSICPIAKTSMVYVDITDKKDTYRLNPEPQSTKTFTRGSHTFTYAVYQLAEVLASSKALNLGLSYNAALSYSDATPPVVHVHHFQTGYGQEYGGIMSLIHNHHPTQDITIVYMQTVPWYLPVFFHTLKIQNFKSLSVGENGTRVRPLHTHFIPGKDRQRSYHLELVLTLPANSVTKVSFQFERALLKWTEYPPDANHGFYVGSAVISTVLPEAEHVAAPPQSSSLISSSFNDTSSSFFMRLHTETLLVTLPTPDFSMPYNVICLACTVVAIAFGSIHNLTTRRFVIQDPDKPKGLIGKVKSFISKFKKKKEPEVQVNTTEADTETTQEEVKS